MERTNKPLVTVVVPVYKVEEYIHFSVDSILSQTYENLQVILVDDGSPDTCPRICDEYARRDPRVQVIHKKNGGVCSARNAGIDQALGSYITFCDSDDGFVPQWIQWLVEAARREHADVVLGNRINRRPNGEEFFTHHQEGLVDTRSPEQKLLHFICQVIGDGGDGHGWEITSRLFKTSIIREHQIRFCESCQNFAEDLGFVMEYGLYADRVLSIHPAGFLYTMREGSMMRRSQSVPKLNAVNEVSCSFLARLNRDLPGPAADTYGPILHFLLMQNQYTVAINKENYHHIGRYLDEIQNRDFWQQETRKIFACRHTLERLYGKITAGRIRIYSRYTLHRCWLLFKIQRFLFYKINHYQD